jgi:hypothetical protein
MNQTLPREITTMEYNMKNQIKNKRIKSEITSEILSHGVLDSVDEFSSSTNSKIRT